VLRGAQLGQPPVVAAAYAATVRAQAAILTVLNTQIKAMEEQVEAHFGKHPDATVYLSQPGLGQVLGARVLAEFGDDKQRYADAKSRKNYAGTSPITRQSGKRRPLGSEGGCAEKAGIHNTRNRTSPRSPPCARAG
jgi:transposase